MSDLNGLVKKWRDDAKRAANGPMCDGASEYAVAGTYMACSDELEAALAQQAGAVDDRQVLPEGWRVSIERGMPGVIWMQLTGPQCSNSDRAYPNNDVKRRIFERFEEALASSAPGGGGGEG